MTHTWIPNEEHGSICSACDVPRFSRTARGECLARYWPLLRAIDEGAA